MIRCILCFVSLCLAIILYSSCGRSSQQSQQMTVSVDENLQAINVNLQKIENEVFIAINQGDKQKALKLMGELVHPSDLPWPGKEKTKMVLGIIEISDGNYTYSGWWEKRRNELRDMIMEMEDKGPGSLENDSITYGLDGNPGGNSSDLNDQYLGLYICRNDDGTSQFYKFIKNPSTGQLNIIYQDNSNGDVIIKNYLLQSFNELTGESNLKSVNDSTVSIKLYFIKDAESSNGFILSDNQSHSFSLVN